MASASGPVNRRCFDVMATGRPVPSVTMQRTWWARLASTTSRGCTWTPSMVCDRPRAGPNGSNCGAAPGMPLMRSS